MKVLNQSFFIALLVIGLAACGGESAGPGGKSGAAASACDVFVKNKLAEKPYKLDLNVLAASFTESAEHSGSMTSPIIIEPGLTTEVKQTLKCELRFSADETPEVLNVSFIW
jgi:hypothetical protein